MNAIASAVRAIDASSLRIQSGVFSGLALRHALLALGFTLGYNVFGQLGLLGSGELSVIIRLKSVSQIPIHLTVACFAILAAVVADNTLNSGPTRWLRYPTAVLIAALAGGLLMEACATPVTDRGAKFLAAIARVPDISSFARAREFVAALYISTLVVALYVVLETNHRVSRALHEVRLRTLVEQRDVCAAELSAMQARVDPELLFESLRRVDEDYAISVERGQTRLDALIRFLRAALPGRSNKSSTIRLEMELVEAYVALVAPDEAARKQSLFQVSPALLDDFVPPMILLPLVRWAIADGPADGLSISIERRDDGSTLALSVDNRGPAVTGRGDAEIQTISHRLECLYGDVPRLRVTATGNQRSAVVEFPTGASGDSVLPCCDDSTKARR